MSVLLVRLGRGVFAEGEVTAYAAIDGQELLDIYTAGSDSDAIAHVRSLSGGASVVCDPGLENAARAAGLPCRPLSDGEAAHRAHFSMFVFAPEMLEGIDPGVLVDYFEASYILQIAAQKDAKQYQFRAELSGRIGDTSVDDEVFVIFNAGPSPRMTVVTRQSFDLLEKGERSFADTDQLSVIFEREPQAMIESLTAAYGLSYVPRPLLMREAEEVSPSQIEVEKLAALMGLSGRFVSANKIGMEWTPSLGGSIVVQFDLLGAAC